MLSSDLLWILPLVATVLILSGGDALKVLLLVVGSAPGVTLLLYARIDLRMSWKDIGHRIDGWTGSALIVLAFLVVLVIVVNSILVRRRESADVENAGQETIQTTLEPSSW